MNEMWTCFDAEFNGLPDVATKLWCIVCIDMMTGEMYEYGPDELERGIAHLEQSKRLVGHNLLGADLPVLEKLKGFRPREGTIIVDTLLLSRLSFPDRVRPYGTTGSVKPHSLEAWAIRLGGELKVQHEDWSQFSDNMLSRCKADARINLEVYNALFKEMSK